MISFLCFCVSDIFVSSARWAMGLLRRPLNSGFTRDSLDASAQISESEKMHPNGGLTRIRSPFDSVSAHRLHTRDAEFDPETRA